MPRCKNCQQKFTPTRFLQKHCNSDKCKMEEKQYQSDKQSGNTPKIHKCKGISIAIGYGCGLPQQNRIHGLGVDCKCYSKWLLTSSAGAEKLKRITIQASAPRIELEQAFEDKKNRTKLATLLMNTRIACHKYIRERDKGKPCISCGIPFLPDFQAGHFYKAELYSNLKFDEKNTNGQCQQCNLRKEGNESGYRSGIIQRFGKEHLNYLDEKAKAYKKNDYHWDRAELEEIRKYYTDKLKDIQSISK